MNSLAQNGPFRGRYEIRLDPKGRLSVPPAFRQALMTGPPNGLPNADTAQPQLVITNSRYKGRSCLDAYSLAEWEQLEKRIARLSPLKAEVQAFNRFYLSGGQAVDVDAQNRVLVPLSLRRFAGLDGPAVLIGLGGKFEIWSLDSWTVIHEQLCESFEETMNAVAALDGEP